MFRFFLSENESLYVQDLMIRHLHWIEMIKMICLYDIHLIHYSTSYEKIGRIWIGVIFCGFCYCDDELLQLLCGFARENIVMDVKNLLLLHHITMCHHD